MFQMTENSKDVDVLRIIHYNIPEVGEKIK